MYVTDLDIYLQIVVAIDLVLLVVITSAVRRMDSVPVNHSPQDDVAISVSMVPITFRRPMFLAVWTADVTLVAPPVRSVTKSLESVPADSGSKAPNATSKFGI